MSREWHSNPAHLICPHCGEAPHQIAVLWAGPNSKGVEQGVTTCRSCGGAVLVKRKTRTTYQAVRHTSNS